MSGVIGIYIIALTLRLGRVPARNLEIIGNLFGIPLMTIELGTFAARAAAQCTWRGSSASGHCPSLPCKRMSQAPGKILQPSLCQPGLLPMCPLSGRSEGNAKCPEKNGSYPPEAQTAIATEMSIIAMRSYSPYNVCPQLYLLLSVHFVFRCTTVTFHLTCPRRALSGSTAVHSILKSPATHTNSSSQLVMTGISAHTRCQVSESDS